MIPHNLTDKHFRRAAEYIDEHGVPSSRDSVHYDLIIGNKRYPPKYVVSIASKLATGKAHPPAAFNAVEARDYFRRRGYSVTDRRPETERPDLVAPEDDESAFAEGQESFRLHRHLERDGAISRKAKATRLAQAGKLECEACGLDFYQSYGKRGYGFIEAHHTLPVSQIRGTTKTKVSDLALVCSNCHRMLHRGTKVLTVGELKELMRHETVA